MSKRTERNVKPTTNHSMVSRHDALHHVKEWLRNPKLKLSGNLQANLLKRFTVEVSQNLRNDEWAAIEMAEGKRIFDGIKAEVRQGISMKFFDVIYDVACKVVPAELKARKKEKRDVYGITVEKLNGFAVEVAFTINGKVAEALTVFNCGSKIGLGQSFGTKKNLKVAKVVNNFLGAIEEKSIVLVA